MTAADRWDVSSDAARRSPGQFARERFRERRRAWRRRIWWILPLAAAFEIAVATGFGLLLQPQRLELYVGIGIGIALAMVMIFLDSPPAHIERWRQGAEGEKATAKALRRFTRNGWALIHDVDTGRGNFDHILVGPAGVFLLESKNLGGLIRVDQGVLTVRWREDPNDGYDIRHLTPCMKARAAELSAALRRTSLGRVWVQPIVVLWGTFEQRSIESQGVAWVRGSDLSDVLAARPATFSEESRVKAAAALENWLKEHAENSRTA
jgi:Nuclease-related domain